MLYGVYIWWEQGQKTSGDEKGFEIPEVPMPVLEIYQ